MRVVIVYDRLVRPDTTGVHCEKALRALGVDTIHYPPLEAAGGGLAFRGWGGLPAADLYLQIDDDIAYPALPAGLPSVYWCIDVHRMDTLAGGPLTRWEKCRGFARVFSAQRDMTERLGAAWLPLAYDPDLMHPLPETPKQWDWCFVGNLNTRRRVGAVAALRACYPNGFVGNAYGAEMNRVYNASRIVVNLSVGNDVNMRFFEAQGTGTPLLSDRVNNGEDALFDDLLLVSSIDEMIERMGDWLADPAGLQAVGARQQARVAAQHSYRQRMRQMLEWCGVVFA